jgi:hypothetical protein
VGIDPAERQKIVYVAGYVKGEAADQRRLRRLPLRLQVTYSAKTGRRINFTRDLNEEGAFVRCTELLAVGEETRLLIMPPGGTFKPIPVRGIVKHLTQNRDERGMGIAFVFPMATERASFAEFIARLEQEYLRGALPDETIG